MHLFFLRCFPVTPKKTAAMKKLILFSLLLPLFSLFTAEIRGRGIAVSDGDTITVLDEMDQGKFKIRLDKIDAPEKKQAFGNKARRYLSSCVSGRDVTVRFRAVDRYGRIIGIVFCGGIEINLAMVQNGYAWHYCFYDKNPAYIQAEKQARSEKKGLWADSAPENPQQFRQIKNSRKSR